MNTKPNIFTNVERILVIKLRHIGDVLLTVPVFRALKETFPAARVVALVNRGTEEVLAGNPLIDEIIPYDRGIKSLPWRERLGREAAFLREIRSRCFDMTVDLTSGDRPALISFLSGARYRLAADPGRRGFLGKRRLYTHLAAIDRQAHTVLQNLQTVSAFGITTATPAVTFAIPEPARRKVAEIFARAAIADSDTVVHIHPTSRWLFKCWNDEAMAEVIRRLLSEGLKVVITSSPDPREMAKAQGILALLPDGCRPLVLLGETTINELAAITARAALFFGVDSAPMHIAAAVGTPVVALFGPSGVFHWGPWDNEAATAGIPAYAQRNGLQRFGRNVAIQGAADCIPCGQDGCEGSKISWCLEEIDVDTVMSIITAQLKETRPGC